MTSSSFSFDIIPNIFCHYHHHRCHHYYCHHYYFHSDNFLPDYQQRDSEEPLLELWPFAVEAANFKVGNLDSYLYFVCFHLLSLSCFVYFDLHFLSLIPMQCCSICRIFFHPTDSKKGFVLLISSCVCLKSYITFSCLNKRNCLRDSSVCFLF